jgi:hypothetical protein
MSHIFKHSTAELKLEESVSSHCIDIIYSPLFCPVLPRHRESKPHLEEWCLLGCYAVWLL